MKLRIFAPAFLTCCLAVPLLATTSSTAASREPVHHSKAELAHLRQKAHTPEQYRALATYYGQQWAYFDNQAAEMKKEWERRSQNIVGSAAKYPRPVDSARNLYQYYSYEAEQAGVLQAGYERLASAGDTATSSPNATH